MADNAPPCFPKAEATPDPISKAIEDTGRVQLYGVNFETDSDVLSPAARPVLDRAAKAVLAHSDWRFSVEGHTDNTGGDAHNQPLSERRAAAHAVMRRRGALIEHGVRDDGKQDERDDRLRRSLYGRLLALAGMSAPKTPCSAA